MRCFFPLFIFGLGFCQFAYGLSSITQLTRKDIQSDSIIDIQAVDEGADHTKIMVKFTAPTTLGISDSISGGIDIRVDEGLIARKSVSFRAEK